MGAEGGFDLDRPVLGLESSCDETAAAVLAPDGRILAEGVLSQEKEHAVFGGVVPEIAARAHLEALPGLAERVLGRTGLGFGDLGAVAATSGPGLIGGLIVGACFGKGVAIAHDLPFVAVNHLEAHALTARLPGLLPQGAPAFPYLLLLVSGGHCQCVAVEGLGRYRRLGSTLDEALVLNTEPFPRFVMMFVLDFKAVRGSSTGERRQASPMPESAGLQLSGAPFGKKIAM